MNVFTEMAHAVYDVKSYPEFLKDRKRKTFLFGFLLALFYFALTVMIPVGQFKMATGGIINMLDVYLPDFELRDGKLFVDGVFELEEGNSYIYVNTEEGYQINESQLRERMLNYEALVVADSERLVFQNHGRIQYLDFADLGTSYMTKSIMLKMFRPYMKAVIWISLICIFLFMEFSFFFGTLVVALAAMIAASAMKSSMTFGELYQMSVYSRTTPLLLKALVSFLPFGVPFLFVIGLVISMIYLVGAMRMVKAQGETAAPEARNVQSAQEAWIGQDNWQMQDGWQAQDHWQAQDSDGEPERTDDRQTNDYWK